MKVLQLLAVAIAIAAMSSLAGAQAFWDNFESYDAGTDLQNVGGWKGWDGSAGASAPVSDTYAASGSNSVEIISSADLVHEFDISGGQWVFSVMLYIPSGTSGTSYFIVLNSYDDGANQDWSVQTLLNLDSGTLNSYYVDGSDIDIIYDAWVEMKLVIDLDENTVDEYYGGTLFATHQWDDDGGAVNTIGAIDLFGNNASSVYYDDILIQTYSEYASKAGGPSPTDKSTDVATDVVLGWTPGEAIATHDVYFGATFADVNAATRSNPMDVLVSQGQGGTALDPEAVLAFGQTYYWRVDEVDTDGTLYPGLVWSFTVEPYMYAIENVTATSNTEPEGGAVPENTVNGSGLDADDLHSREDADMWLGTAGEDPVYIQFDFDSVYKLYDMLIWNYNGEFEWMLGFGLQDVTVEYTADGAEWAVLGDFTLAQGISTAGYAANTTIEFGGVSAKAVRLTVNSAYGTYGQYGLSEVRFYHLPVAARMPKPADEATDVAVDTVLAWRAGREAASHDVYLGTDAEALELVASTTTASDTPDALDLATTYYWKVDEVNEAEAVSKWEGALWSFTTQPFLAVDDFEGYNDDDNVIYETWEDGWFNETGSTVGYFEAPFAEQTIVNSGMQSMPLSYDNAGVATAEAELALDQDWTASGIQSLSLYFYGDADNTGQLFVKINGTKVVYDGDAADIKRAMWQVWNIDLAATGASLSNVSTLTIGIEGTGAEGIVYIDNIRLYPEMPQFIVPTEPDAAGLVARYTFDGSTNDSSGNGLNGTANGSPTYVAGANGQAINFNGTTDYVVVGSVGISGADARTISGWVKPDTLTITDWCNIFGFTSAASGNDKSFDMNKRGSEDQYCIHVYGWERNIMEIDLEWHHLAATYDGNTIAWYGDGRFVGREEKGELSTEDIVHMGKRAHSDPMWPGSVDEVRIYNQALSAEEIAWLAGQTQPLHKPF